MYSMIIDASVNNIPISFDSTPGSLVGVNIPAGSRVAVLNCTESNIAFSIADYNSTPSSDIVINRNQGFCIAQGTAAMDSIHISNRAEVYIRSLDGSPITSGMVYITTWGHR